MNAYIVKFNKGSCTAIVTDAKSLHELCNCFENNKREFKIIMDNGSPVSREQMDMEGFIHFLHPHDVWK